MLSTTLCIDQLRLSDLNVRTNQIDATETAALEASILAEGLIHALAVHSLEDGLFGVFAGGRRYRSIRNLVDRGDLPADWSIAVTVHTAAPVEIVARSLDENMLRRQLQPYEEYAALALEAQLGRTPEQLAERHGQRLLWIHQALRLGQLAPEVFEALERGELSVDQAKAIGATADQDLQREAWRRFSQMPAAARTPATIRAWLCVGDQDAGRLLRFVGEEAYRSAGGGWEADLFSDGTDEVGRVTDDALLRRLADAKVETIRAATRTATARPDLRFLTQAPRSGYGGPDYTLAITPEERDGHLPLPDGDVAAVVEIALSGGVTVTYWWADRKAYNAATRATAKPETKLARAAPHRTAGAVAPGAAIGQQYDDSRQKADAAIKEETGLTKEGIDALRSIRRAILRTALVRDAREGRTLARDYLIWAQLRMLVSPTGDDFGTATERQTGIRRLAAGGLETDGDVARGIIGASEAGKEWGKAVASLQQRSFCRDKDLGGAFLDFLAADEATRALAAAIVAGLALERSLDAFGYDIAVHDVLAVRARLSHPANIRRWWTPTAAFLRLIPRAEQLAIAEPLMERAVFGTWQRLRIDELLPLVLKLVTGKATNVRKSMATAAADWVHPLLAFRVDAGRAAPAQEEAA
ncbi:MAG: ParB/RepB/Spo0J family partition protein [Janthinobacterium lividum]